MSWMKYNDEWHLKECLVSKAKYLKLKRYYKWRWPSYCRTCMGAGEIPYTEAIRVLGSDPCPDCAEKGKCPRCGSNLVEYFEDVLLKSGRLPSGANVIGLYNEWLESGEKCPICQGTFPKDRLGYEPECFCYEQPPPVLFPVVGWTITHASEHDRTVACIIRGDSRRLYLKARSTSLNRLRRVAEGRGWSLSLYICEDAVMLYWDRPDASLERPDVWL